MDTFFSPLVVLTRIGSISNNVQIDITNKVVEKYRAKMSSYATEEGVPKSDSRILLPVEMWIEGGFKDITISKMFGSELTNGARKKRAIEQFDKLLVLFMSEETFPLMNGVHLVEDYQFTDLDMIKDEPKFSLKFTARLQQMPQFKIGSKTSQPNPQTIPQFLTAEAEHMGTKVPPEFKDAYGIIG